VVYKNSKQSGFVLCIASPTLSEVGFEKYEDNGGKATCNVYFPLSRGVGPG